MRRKTLLIGCFGLFIVLGLVLALLMGGDDELLPDDDLRPALRVELPKEQNAYSLLQAIATDLGAGGSLDPAALERAVQAEGYVPPVADFLGDGTGTDVLGMMEVADAASLLVELRLQAGDGVEARRLALLLGAMSDLVAAVAGPASSTSFPCGFGWSPSTACWPPYADSRPREPRIRPSRRDWRPRRRPGSSSRKSFAASTCTPATC